MLTLGPSPDVLRSAIGYAVRFVDAHLGRDVVDPLIVRISGPGTFEPLGARGGGTRNSDGTYRFRPVPAGAYVLEVEDPKQHWTLAPGPHAAAVPTTTDTPHEVALYPTPRAPAPLGITTIRGTLSGVSAAEVRVQALTLSAPVISAWVENEAFVCFLRPDIRPPATDPLAWAITAPPHTIAAATLEGAAVDPSSFTLPPGRSSRLHLSLT